MDYGDATSHKFEFAAKLGLGFAYLTAEENNDFQFCTFRDRENRIDTGQSNRGELLSLIDQLNEMTPGGTADFESALEAYAERIRSRSLVVVFSDCLADPEALESGIAALARNDADVLLVRVVAPAERDPGVVGDVLFADPESDENAVVSQRLAG